MGMGGDLCCLDLFQRWIPAGAAVQTLITGMYGLFREVNRGLLYIYYIFIKNSYLFLLILIDP